jgi:hypothetical protein
MAVEIPRQVVTAPGQCFGCRTTRPITGPVVRSLSGVRRVQGKCQACGHRGQGLLSVVPTTIVEKGNSMSKVHAISLDPYVIEVNAENLRVGRQLLTADGWQTIRGLIMFADADQVSIYTDERDDVETSGWSFGFGDRVQTRLEPTEEQLYQARRRERLERKRLRRVAMEAAGCPEWCVEHYDGGTGQERARNHSAAPQAITGAHVYTGELRHLGFWLERRDNLVTGSAETVVVIETRPHNEDIEFTPEQILQLAARLSSLGHRGGLHGGKAKAKAEETVDPQRYDSAGRLMGIAMSPVKPKAEETVDRPLTDVTTAQAA